MWESEAHLRRGRWACVAEPVDVGHETEALWLWWCHTGCGGCRFPGTTSRLPSRWVRGSPRAPEPTFFSGNLSPLTNAWGDVSNQLRTWWGGKILGNDDPSCPSPNFGEMVPKIKKLNIACHWQVPTDILTTSSGAMRRGRLLFQMPHPGNNRTRI